MLSVLTGHLRARSILTSTGRLLPLTPPNDAVVTAVDDLERRRLYQRQWYADNKERLSASRKQRRLVAGLAGMTVSALPRIRSRRYTLPQLLRALDDNRAVAVRVFDVRQVSTLCNYLVCDGSIVAVPAPQRLASDLCFQVVASAASLRHLEAISSNVARAARSHLQSPRLASRLDLMSDSVRCQYDIESRYRQYQMHGEPVPEPLHDESLEDDDGVEYRALR